jgi:hypothetical protein
MAVDPANASELAEIASEIGADVLEGDLRYPSDAGGGVAVRSSMNHPFLPRSASDTILPVHLQASV